MLSSYSLGLSFLRFVSVAQGDTNVNILRLFAKNNWIVTQQRCYGARNVNITRRRGKETIWSHHFVFVPESDTTSSVHYIKRSGNYHCWTISLFRSLHFDRRIKRDYKWHQLNLFFPVFFSHSKKKNFFDAFHRIECIRHFEDSVKRSGQIRKKCEHAENVHFWLNCGKLLNFFCPSPLQLPWINDR